MDFPISENWKLSYPRTRQRTNNFVDVFFDMINFWILNSRYCFKLGLNDTISCPIWYEPHLCNQRIVFGLAYHNISSNINRNPLLFGYFWLFTQGRHSNMIYLFSYWKRSVSGEAESMDKLVWFSIDQRFNRTFLLEPRFHHKYFPYLGLIETPGW